MAKQIPIDTQKLSVNVLRQVDGMRRDKKHCDFLIKVGSEEIPVHRNILSASSDFFDAMFSHPTKENESGVVEMMGVDPECTVICVDHMYGKEVSILPEKYEPLMYVANLMQLHTLRDAIASLLEANLDLKTYFVTNKIASMYECKKLEEKCYEFAEENFRLISREEEFGELDKTYIEKMIKSNNAKVTDEEKLDGLLIWINSVPGRGDFLPEMVAYINLSNVSVACRRFMIEKEPLVRDNFQLFRQFCHSMLNTLNVSVKPIGKATTASNIVIFDSNSKHLQSFNPEINTWKQMHEMNDDMKSGRFSAVSLDDNIYVLMENKSVYRIKYSDESATWIGMADMKKDHGQCPPATVLSGLIYVIGGHNQCSTKSFEVYAPATNQWIILKDKQLESKWSEVLSSQGYIYSFGGYVNDQFSDEVTRFDSITSTWSYVTSMDERMAYVSAVEYSGQLYVLGGFVREGDVVRYSSASRYDAEQDAWTSLNPMSTARSWLRAFAIGGFIYAAGGYTNSPDSIEKYDVEKNEWEMVEIPSEMKLKIVESVKITTSN